MKTSFKNISNACRNSALVLIFLTGNVFAFQTEYPTQAVKASSALSDFELMEAGLASRDNVSPALLALTEGRYKETLDQLSMADQNRHPWLEGYLVGLIEVFTPLVKEESEHFILSLPEDQKFLAPYVLDSLEKVRAYLATSFKHTPKGKIRVEIYSNKEDFSKASTLSVETLERSGAIGICKFRRLMIMSPRSLPLGYRWLDALSHEYIHLMVNELTHTKAELWLHEGIARYFETSFRVQPPVYLTPHQKTALLEAQEKGTLVPFAKMSPSMVYLKDQEQVSLAFSQVSQSVDTLVETRGMDTFLKFLTSLRTSEFPKAFQKAFKKTPEGFEKEWQDSLPKKGWTRTKGAMSDTIQFTPVNEGDLIGADVQGQVRLGDRMRMKNLYEAALIEYEKSLRQEPDNAVVLLKAARALLAMNQKDKAIEKLRKAIEKNPNYGTPYVELGMLLEGEEQVKVLLEANAINPFDPRIHGLLAKAYTGLNRPKDAEREQAIHKSLAGETR